MGRELDVYLDTLFANTQGYVYAATKHASGDFTQDHFLLPGERAGLHARILKAAEIGESYLCPAVFATASGKKDQCLGSQVAWVDFDGNFPESWPTGIPEPTLVVQTSTERRVHAYWKLDTFLEAREIEEINRRLSYFFSADLSGWDANQLLRPPETRNHKRGNRAVSIILQGDGICKVNDFVGLPSPPKLPANLEAIPIPPIEEALARIKFTSNLQELFEKGLPQGQRSEGMFALAAGLAELSNAPQDILSILLHADNKVFHKFDQRADQLTRLVELVTRACAKVKAKPKKETPTWQAVNISTLLQQTWKLEWLLYPYIHKTTVGVLSGPPGVGKSLMTSSLAQSLAIGREFLGVAPIRPLKTGFISLEMDGFELHAALTQQVKPYSSEERSLLDQNFLILPFGEPRFWNDKETEQLLFEFVGDNNLDGIFIDSLSSTTAGDLSSEKETKFIFELDAKLRARFKCFTWYIHHNRKAQADNKRPNKLADLHGSVHIQSKPTTILTLWPLDTQAHRVAFKPLKIRSTGIPDEFVVSKDTNLHFNVIKGSSAATFAGVTVMEGEDASPEQPEQEPVNDIGSDDSNPPGDGSDGEGGSDFYSGF